MRKFRGVRYSLAILMVVNFIAVMLNSIIYLQATNYIIAQRQASLLAFLLRPLQLFGCLHSYLLGLP